MCVCVCMCVSVCVRMCISAYRYLFIYIYAPCLKAARSKSTCCDLQQFLVSVFQRVSSRSQDVLQKVGLLSSVFGRLRPPQTPAHCVAMSIDDVPRCVRCLLPEALLHQRQIRPAGTCSHAVWALEKGLFACGAEPTLSGMPPPGRDLQRQARR
jgi:hypothetical protein